MNNELLLIDTILDFCDQPQLLTARDKYDSLFLCLLFSDIEFPDYTAIKITKNELKNLQNGMVDLRDLMSFNSGNTGFYITKGEADGLRIIQTVTESIPEERLPERGYTLTPEECDQITVNIPRNDRSLFTSVMKRFGWIAM